MRRRASDIQAGKNLQVNLGLAEISPSHSRICGSSSGRHQAVRLVETGNSPCLSSRLHTAQVCRMPGCLRFLKVAGNLGRETAIGRSQCSGAGGNLHSKILDAHGFFLELVAGSHRHKRPRQSGEGVPRVRGRGPCP
ncbi:hypothetical protein [Sandarakinorhabdus limnophila]|uniref:hypothetical protein n=1 Tax=Sandarakinorhabdus limnophila TaxID=210512 RepID=UPI00313783F5